MCGRPEAAARSKAPADFAAERKPILRLSDMLAGAGTFAAFAKETAELAPAIQHTALVAGHRRGWNDIQVAATALQLREPMVTVDQRFAGIDGLRLVVP